MAPAPSMTLQITKNDAEHFLEASQVLQVAWEGQPLDVERLYERAQQSKHTFVVTFMDRLLNSGLSLIEKQLAMLLFVDTGKTEKLKIIFSKLAREGEINYDGAVALFRAVLTAISCCIQQNHHQVIFEVPSPERPMKRQKMCEETASTKQMTEDVETKPSFDSFTEEREIQEICSFAAEELMQFSKTVSFKTFGEWYNTSGKNIVPWIELLQQAKWKGEKSVQNDSSPGSLTEDSSPTLISFDFSGSECPHNLCINITGDNLQALRHLVYRTGLLQCQPADLCKLLLSIANRRGKQGEPLITLRRDAFRDAIGKLIIPTAMMQQLSHEEREAFQAALMDVFLIMEAGRPELQSDEVDLKELAIGMCFFCAGNKSTKLATGFELLDDKRMGYLTEGQLFAYIQAHLLTLSALSFIVPINKPKHAFITPERRTMIREAVESGAKWTIGHFLNSMTPSEIRKNKFTFETFALWYSNGGYNVAPWLELLDLNKVLSLIAESASPLPLPPFPERGYEPLPRDRISSLRRHHSSRRAPTNENLFLFPLAGQRSLMVLKDDARYVRDVVDMLGLLSINPQELWDMLSKSVSKRRKPKKGEVAVYVNSKVFVECMKEVCPRAGRKRSSPGSAPTATELLSNFFQCFDINQVDSVALDELMGGLTLLCGGKKSSKLSFAFGIFDTRPGMNQNAPSEGDVHSLIGEDLFLFLRSILIVLFSCCRQSLDMTDETVSRCISDTANMICNDVMRRQWEVHQKDRLTFDEFGEWYNEGGMERAPWLELLDLKKWVLADNLDNVQKQHSGKSDLLAQDPLVVPPPPPEDALDPAFFDEHGILPMDSMDEMDMILMQQPSRDEGDMKIMKSFSFSVSPKQRQPSFPPPSNHPQESHLEFHLVTNESHGGYKVSISRSRIDAFRRILCESGIHQAKVEDACNALLNKSVTSKKTAVITRDGLESAAKTILHWSKASSFESKQALSSLLGEIFEAFDLAGDGKPSAIDIACGLTILCQGSKSDKLQFAFELLDKDRCGELCKKDMSKYLQSFLRVLLCLSFSPSLTSYHSGDFIASYRGDHLERSTETITRVVELNAECATSLAFSDLEQRRNKESIGSISFDDFGEWYSTIGFRSIAWLELIDLRKWALTPA